MPENPKRRKQGSNPGDEPVTVGRILRAHGIRGEVRIKPLTAIVNGFQTVREVVVEFDDGHIEQHTIVNTRGAGSSVIVRFEDIGNREDAIRLTGAYVSVPRSTVPKLGKDRFYVSDLVGMRVVDTAGRMVGSVTYVEEYPANDVLVVRGEAGEIMVPAIRDYVLNIDTSGKTITIRVPENLTDNS